MGQQQDPAKKHGDDLEHVLKEAADAGRHPDEGEIAADDAGGTRLAQTLDGALGEDDDEPQAHPS